MNTVSRISVAVMVAGVLSFVGTLFIMFVTIFSFDAGVPPIYFHALAWIVCGGILISWILSPNYVAKPGDPQELVVTLMSVF